MEKKYGWRIGSNNGYSLWKIRDEEILQIVRYNNGTSGEYIQLDESECPDYKSLKRRGDRYFMQIKIDALESELKLLKEKINLFDYEE